MSSFYPCRSQKTDKVTLFFALSGSAPIKTAQGMLMKLTPVNTTTANPRFHMLELILDFWIKFKDITIQTERY